MKAIDLNTAETATILPLNNDTRLRLHWVDNLRGLAALCVVIYHSAENSKIISSGLKIIGFLNLGVTAVYLFFIISGFVMCLSTQNPLKNRTFLKRRFIRLYFPYLICILISIALCLMGIFGNVKLASLQVYYELNPVRYIIGLVTVQLANLNIVSPIGVDWTLSVETLFYIQAFVFTITGLSRQYRIIYVLFLLLSIISDLCRYFPFLYVGTIFWDYYRKQISFRAFLVYITLLPICSFTRVCLTSGLPGSHVEFVSATIPLIIFYSAMKAPALFDCLILRQAGKFSYSLYLVHMIPLNYRNSVGNPLPMFISWCLILMLTLIFYYGCEIRFLNLSHQKK